MTHNFGLPDWNFSRSWLAAASNLNEEIFDSSVKNPNSPEEALLHSSTEIINRIYTRDVKTKSILEKIRTKL